MKQVLSRAVLAVHHFKTKGKKLKVKDILDGTQRNRLVNLDEGFYIFRTIPNSPAYLEKCKKDAFAMIRHLGFPSLFISQSAAETILPGLLRPLGQLIDNKTCTDDELQAVSWETRFRLVKHYPVTVVWYFDHIYQQFLHQVVKCLHYPVLNVTDYFTRLAFASRDSIYVHWFAYLKHAPKYGEDYNEDITDYFDHIISCSSDVPAALKQFILLQLYRHVRLCRVGKTHQCKCGFPKPPMCKMMILEPLQFETEDEELQFKSKWHKIQKYLTECGMTLDNITTDDKMLSELDMTHDNYIKAVWTSIVRPKLFLKHRLCEIRINAYMKNCLHFWWANHNIQPVLDPYATIQYILSYVTKIQNSLSNIMDCACREARMVTWIWNNLSDILEMLS